MIINEITIKNFRCYYGESTISFNSDGKITLIYGDSGYGKSSFLQFFRWMFYGDPDFGKSDDKPLFNIAAYNECKFGDKVEVSGTINFIHQGVSYRLHKAQYWTTAFVINNSRVEKQTYELLVKGEDNGYHPFVGNVANQINAILPKGLSKYFLLDGERARDIVLDSEELKKAIHALFGLDAYTEAISHIGNTNARTSVLGHYASILASKTKATGSNKMSTADLQDTIQDLYDEIEDLKTQRKDLMAVIEQKEKRREEILQILGAAASKDNLQSLIRINERTIKEREHRIHNYQTSIGSLFYSTYPYLFLAEITSECATILRAKNHEYASSYQNVFENLKKNLLIEILEKDVCVCGRELDDETRKRLNAIIDIMPPGSYVYEFGQFIAKAKRFIRDAQHKTYDYDIWMTKISVTEEEIETLEAENREKLEELRRLDEAKDLVDELTSLKNEIAALSTRKAGFEGTIAQKKQVYDISNRQLRILLENSQVSSQYTGIIKFFNEIAKQLRDDKKEKEAEIRILLNRCVRDIFCQLTTQTELDANSIQFVNDDFSLRTTYLTGGQLAVDVYSYVIGIIKALQESQMENNENPIIIDAPFAFTGNAQSEHLFQTLPRVCKQTILLTLDLNKIKKLLGDTELYDFYVIDNDSQDHATIHRGDINAIKL